MAPPLEQIVRTYRPLIGRRMTGFAWKPIPCDTPGLVRDFGNSSFSFSGGVQFQFEPDLPLFLTWTSRAPMTLELRPEEDAWLPGSLDRIGPDMASSWIEVVGATLVGVDLFTCGEDWADGLAPLNGAPVGARHRLQGDAGASSFWVGTGYGDNIREADDLWVGLNVDPANLADLQLVAALEA